MKRKFLSVTLVLVMAIALPGFIDGDRENVAPTECHIVVGIGHKQTKCGGDKGITVNEDIDFVGAGGNISYDDLSKAIITAMQEQHGIDKKDIKFSYGSMPYAVIIKYDKKIIGWNCKVTRIAAGFGKTETDAENDAKKKKNNDSGEATYRVIKTYTCG